MKFSFAELGRNLFGYFLRGVLLVSPVFLTAYAIIIVARFFDNLIPGLYPGVSIAIILVGITVIGYYSYTILFQSLLNLIERIILKTPGLKIIYSSIKDLTSGLAGSKKTFNQPVLVIINRESGIRKMGFVTRNDLSGVGMADLVAVYFPHSYNFSGELFLVPRDNVSLLPNFPSADAMKFIVSGGIAFPSSTNASSK